MTVVVEAGNQEVVNRVAAIRERLEQKRRLIEAYRGLLVNERSIVLGLFRQTRTDLENYLKDHGLPSATAWHAQALRQLDNWRNGRATDGQEADAQELAGQIAEHLDATLEATEELDEDFREEFDGTFLGPLGSTTIEELAEASATAQQVRQINERGARDRLSDERAGQADLLARVDAAFDQAQEAIDDLPEQAREPASLKNKEFRAKVKAHLQSQFNSLIPVRTMLREALDPDRIEDELSRAELEELLR